MLKVFVGCAKNQVMLHSQCGNPEVVGRYGDGFLAEIKVELRVVVCRLLVGHEYRDSRGVEESLEVGGICRLEFPGGKARSQFTQDNQRNIQVLRSAKYLDSV